MHKHVSNTHTQTYAHTYPHTFHRHTHTLLIRPRDFIRVAERDERKREGQREKYRKETERNERKKEAFRMYPHPTTARSRKLAAGTVVCTYVPELVLKNIFFLENG